MAQDTSAYKFSLFGPLDGTAAPQLEPDYDDYETEQIPEKPQPVKKKKARKAAAVKTVTKADKAATAASFFISIKMIAIVAAVCLLFGTGIYFLARNAQLTSKISSIETNFGYAQSERVRLTSELEALVSIDKVNEYAEQLGMVKLENYKITYFNDTQEAKVVVSGGKSYENDSLIAKIKNLWEYIT